MAAPFEPGLASIIMLCRNGLPFLKATIDSVRAQTYPHWDLVFIDHAPTDGSTDLAHSYNDPRIRVITQSVPRTLGGLREPALSHVRGEYIGFLDSDDMYFPDTLAALLCRAARQKEISRKDWLVRCLPELPRALLPRWAVAPAAVLWRRVLGKSR